MSRSSNAPPPLRNESNVTQEQLSLFAPKDTGEHTELASPSVKNGAKQTTRTRKQSGYSAADIQVLEGIPAIRHRPGMYIGSTSASGLVHLIWEALDNAVDEAVAGYGKQIWVYIGQEGWVTVRDEGRGMPFDPMRYQGELLPAATV